MANRIVATTWDEGECQRIIQKLVVRFDDGSDGQGGVWGAKLHNRMRWRRAHFHNLKEADPVLSEPYDAMQKDQSDLPRRAHNAVKARLLENHFKFVGKPKGKDDAERRQKADRVAAWMNQQVSRIEEERGQTLQEALTDGQGIRGFGLLYVRLRPELLPEVEGSSPEERAEKMAGTRGLVEIECPDPLTFFFVPDRHRENNLGIGLFIETVGLVDYNEAADGWLVNLGNTGEKVITSIQDFDPKVDVGMEIAAPITGGPSVQQWGERIAVATLLTRNEWYELISYIGDSDVQFMGTETWTLVKSGPHPMGVVPCPMASANGIAFEGDPVLRYEPYLEGVFRKKGINDRLDALEMALAEQTALPTYYLEEINGNARKLDEKGDPIIFNQNAASAMTIPEGWQLKKVDFSVDSGFNVMVTGKKEEMAEAVPPSGRASFKAGTTAWTARLEQNQENVEPKMLLEKQVLALTMLGKILLRAIGASAEDGGFGEPLYFVYEGEDGKRKQEVIMPEDAEMVEISAEVNNVSSAEQLTLEEHGRAMLDDPLMPLTPERYLKMYTNDPDPMGTLMDWEAWKLYEQYVKPGRDAQIVAKLMGSNVVLGVNGETVGPDGRPMPLQDFAQQKGITPAADPNAPPPPVPGTTQGPQAVDQISPPTGGPLNVPNTMPVGALQ